MNVKISVNNQGAGSLDQGVDHALEFGPSELVEIRSDIPKTTHAQLELLGEFPVKRCNASTAANVIFS